MTKQKENELTDNSKEDLSEFGGYVPYMQDIGRNLTFIPEVMVLFLEPSINLKLHDLDIDVSKINPFELQRYVDNTVTLMNNNILCSHGLVINPKIKSIPNVMAYFNRLLILLNILGIPLNFLDSAVIAVYYIADSFYKIVEHGRTHYNIGDLTSEIIIAEEVSKLIIEKSNYLYSMIIKNDFFEETLIYEFLARGKRAFFNRDYRLSFVYNWIFNEALLTKRWEEAIIEKHGSRQKAKSIINSKNWTMAIKIEELFLLNKLTSKESKVINTLRQKRNFLFHFDVRKEKRKVTHKDAELCLEIAHKLFYQELGLEYPKEYIDFPEIREEIYDKLRRKTPSSITIR